MELLLLKKKNELLKVWKVFFGSGAVGAVKDDNLERVVFTKIPSSSGVSRSTQSKELEQDHFEQRNDCGSFTESRGCKQLDVVLCYPPCMSLCD